jgi:hypothetical protein
MLLVVRADSEFACHFCELRSDTATNRHNRYILVHRNRRGWFFNGKTHSMYKETMLFHSAVHVYRKQVC